MVTSTARSRAASCATCATSTSRSTTAPGRSPPGRCPCGSTETASPSPSLVGDAADAGGGDQLHVLVEDAAGVLERRGRPAFEAAGELRVGQGHVDAVADS